MRRILSRSTRTRLTMSTFVSWPAYSRDAKRLFARLSVLGFAFAFAGLPGNAAAESICYGTVSHGRLEQGVQLPEAGANFSAYGALGVLLGRTYLHTRVAEVVTEAYAAQAVAQPEVRYVYGETGWAAGGRFRPHRTHQNGLSIDFFVPVRNAAGASVPLPTGMTNRLGYDIEFDADGRYGEYTIDFAAMAEHLYQLQQAAQAHRVGIALVIFDAPYLPKLFATARGAYLQQHLPFMKGKPWIRHDEHYHVDFSLPCKPL